MGQALSASRGTWWVKSMCAWRGYGLQIMIKWTTISISWQNGKVRPLPNDQTLLIQHFRFALQQMFERLATSESIAWQAKVTKFAAWCFWKSSETFFAWRKQKMLDEQCFWTWPYGQTLCLRSKSQMFDQQCLIVWPGPYHLLYELFPMFLDFAWW